VGSMNSLGLLSNQRFMNVRNNSTAGDGGLDKTVQFLVSSDSELEMPWRDALNLQVLGCISGQLQHFRRQIFQDGSAVDSCRGADPAVRSGPRLKMSMDPPHGKLEARTLRSRYRLSLRLAGIFPCFSSSRHGTWSNLQ